MRSIERLAFYIVIALIAIFAVIVLFVVADIPAPVASAPTAAPVVTSTVAPAPNAPPANAVPVATITRRPTRASKATLRAAPGQTRVQMFDAISDSADVIATLSSGTECTKLDGPRRVEVAGMSMSFYELDCGGYTGYVNAKWVQ